MPETYTVEFVDREATIEVSRNQSILEAAEAYGLDLPYQCRMGVCGVCCAIRVNDSEVDQSEGMFLSEQEQDQGYMLTCIAKPLSDIVCEADESP